MDRAWSAATEGRINEHTCRLPSIKRLVTRRDQHLKNGLFPTLGLQRTCETVYIHMLSQHHIVVLKHRNDAMWWTVAGNWIETWRIVQMGLELDGPTSCKKQLWFLLLVKQWGQSIRLLPAQDALHPASCAKTFSGTGSVHIFKSRQIKFKPKLILTLTHLSCPFSILSAP